MTKCVDCVEWHRPGTMHQRCALGLDKTVEEPVPEFRPDGSIDDSKARMVVVSMGESREDPCPAYKRLEGHGRRE